MTQAIEPGQKWDLDLFHPEDAPGVVRLFRLVYGDGYPVKTFTDPARLIEENAARRTISNVARTPQGDIVGHSALYRSAPFQGLYESGATLTASNYRGGVLGVRLLEHSIKVVARQFGIDSIFGEVVCNHIAMQKISVLVKSVPCALEVDLMPAEAYSKEESAPGRVATILTFIINANAPQTIYVPGAYEEMLRFLYGGIRHECRLVPSSGELPPGIKTRVETRIFDFARVARFTVHDAGEDFATVFAAAENVARQQGALVHQVWLQLSWPWVGRTVEVLRSRGYFTGGVLPRWFDVDGFLMQKVFGPPHWDGIKIYGDRAGRIFKMVKADWDETQNRSREARDA